MTRDLAPADRPALPGPPGRLSAKELARSAGVARRPLPRQPRLRFDHRAPTFAMPRHLIGLGHRRFGLLSAHTAGNDRAMERGAGIRAALAEASLALADECVQHGPIDLGAAAAMMKTLLALPASRRPTAVLGTTD